MTPGLSYFIKYYMKYEILMLTSVTPLFNIFRMTMKEVMRLTPFGLKIYTSSKRLMV